MMNWMGKCITYKEHEKCINNVSPNYMEIIHFRDPAVDGMLQWILRIRM
jgi:hypothetical protein